jgi:LysM repeat protein
VRIPALLFSLALGFSVTPRLLAQDPGAQQDAEAAREKLLKAEDEIDNIQANSETSKTAVDGMKTDVAALQADVTKLQNDNAALRQQLADLQASLDQFKAEQIKARQTLIDNVAGMLAADKASTKKKKETPDSETKTETSVETQTPDTRTETPGLAPPPDAPSASSNGGDAATSADNTPPPKPQKGYYHVVASGETLTMICAAYRDNGVKVTVSQIRKANGLTEDSVLKTGQKLFIPKPGT